MFPNMIYDRTSVDVERAEYLRSKLISQTITADELHEYLSSPKGMWNNETDLNRIEGACEWIVTLLKKYGYIIEIEIKTDWKVGEFQTFSQLERIRGNLEKLRSAYYTFATTPNMPTMQQMDSMDYQTANDLEHILHDINTLIENMINAFQHSGATYSGAGGIRI